MKKDKIPFGTEALYGVLPEIFPRQTITDENFPLYNSLYGKKYTHSNYIIINREFSPDKLDTRELLDFVMKGNSAFIAANYFSGKFADTLKLQTDNFSGPENVLKNDSSGVKNIYKPFDTVKINFTNLLLKNETEYIYTKGIENTYFSSFDSSKTTALGVNTTKKINFIRIKWGKGQFIISTVPEAFTNYLFVNEKNYTYCYKALSYLPNQQVIWDEYYKTGNITNSSPLRVIFSNPALMTAYYVLMFSLILFIIVGVKRKQRIIPVIEPIRNTTLDFVDIVGTLYYQSGDHKNIADKKISYFLEYIRSAFQVNTTLYDDAFIERIANLSGIEKQNIHNLFYYFSDLNIKQTITEQELLKLNRMIELFHKENRR